MMLKTLKHLAHFQHRRVPLAPPVYSVTMIYACPLCFNIFDSRPLRNRHQKFCRGIIKYNKPSKGKPTINQEPTPTATNLKRKAVEDADVHDRELYEDHPMPDNGSPCICFELPMLLFNVAWMPLHAGGSGSPPRASPNTKQKIANAKFVRILRENKATKKFTADLLRLRKDGDLQQVTGNEPGCVSDHMADCTMPHLQTVLRCKLP